MKKKSDSILGVPIEKIQKIELEILLEFKRICDKHKIKYQLFAGSLIGAIRHKGFIPWDDDIDVCMLRSEYNKFLSLVDKELDDKYFFQCCERDPNYVNKFPKIRKNETVFMEKLVEGVDMHHGLYIDIFPFDNIRPQTFRGRFQLWSLRTVDKLSKNNLVKALPISKASIEKWAFKTMKKFNHEKTEYIGDLANPRKDVLESFMMKRKEMENTIDWEFEGHEFPVPKDYDKVLTRAYGDYMTLPDKADRVSHHDIVKVDIGKN